MKLRRNEYCPIHRSVRSAAAANQRIMRAHCSLVFDALMTHIIRGDIGNSDPQLKCGNS